MISGRTVSKEGCVFRVFKQGPYYLQYNGLLWSESSTIVDHMIVQMTARQSKCCSFLLAWRDGLCLLAVLQTTLIYLLVETRGLSSVRYHGDRGGCGGRGAGGGVGASVVQELGHIGEGFGTVLALVQRFCRMGFPTGQREGEGEDKKEGGY